MKQLIMSILALSIFFGCAEEKTDVSGEKEKTAESEIQQIMQSHKAVGLAVAAVKDGNIVYSKTFGYKDLENKTPMEEDDVLRIASISKTFVATAIMQLVEQGKLNLKADISELMGFEIRNPHFPKDTITVEMLLSHTSSMSDSNGYFTLDQLNPAVSPTWQKAWNNYKPGSAYQYCNLGYNTLGAIIEIASGERFDKYIRNHILNPLNVYASHNVADLDSTKFIKIYKYNHSSNSYACTTSAYDAPTSELANYRMGYSTPCFSPTGGLKISAKDLARVMMMHMNYGELDEVRILDSASCALMQSEITPTNYPGESYGMAMISTNDLIQGRRVKGHDGLALGAYTIMYWDREKNFGVVAMTNGCDGETDKTFANILCETAECLYKHFAVE